MSNSRIKTATDQRTFTLVYNDFLKSKLLTSDERLVFIYLKMHSDNYSGKSYPSLNTLAKETGLSKRTVQRCLSELQEKGVVSVEHRISDRGTQSNLYTIYDAAAIWNASDVSEIQSIASEYKEHEMIKYLQSRGYNVTKKELASATDQSTDTSTNANNIFDTIYNSTICVCGSQPVDSYSMENLKKMFDYEALAHDNPYQIKEIDSVMEIIYDTLNSTKKTIRIMGENKPLEVVKSKLLKLSGEEIIYSIGKFGKVTGRISDPRRYMLTILYSASEQMHLDIKNQVQHDLYGGNADDYGMDQKAVADTVGEEKTRDYPPPVAKD